jgi:hypothetical protein
MKKFKIHIWRFWFDGCYQLRVYGFSYVSTVVYKLWTIMRPFIMNGVIYRQPHASYALLLYIICHLSLDFRKLLVFDDVIIKCY